MLHLMCFEEDEPIFVKFKVKKEMELFVNAISMEEGDISYRNIKWLNEISIGVVVLRDYCMNVW